jgi:glycosyltransferase involved in cell wall biosynthesis
MSMRVLVVAPNIRIPDTHGGSTHVAELVAGLRAHAPTLLVAREGSTGDDVVGVGMLGRTPPAGLRHAIALLHAARAWRAAHRFAPDVVYERGSAWGTGAMLATALGIPLVAMVLDEHASPLSLARAHAIIATDPTLVPRRFRGKAVRVSWGANVGRFHAGIDGGAVRARFGLARAPVVAYAGSFRAWHGLDAIVGAAERLVGRHVRFLMIGDGPEREPLAREIARRGLADRFAFAGAVPYADVPAHLAAADLFVAPFDPDAHPLSRRRGFALDPLKLFEALAMDLPTITVDAPNIAALFHDGVHLRLVAPRDPVALADAIARGLDRPDEARAMARRGGDKVRREHTWAAHARHLTELFAAAIAGRR